MANWPVYPKDDNVPLPFPKPISRYQARMNAVHFAEAMATSVVPGAALAPGMAMATQAQIWAAIADTFPLDGTKPIFASVKDDEDEKEWEWARRQIDKFGHILQETMNRVDRLEGKQNPYDREIIVAEAEERIVAYMTNSFSEATIQGVVNALHDAPGDAGILGDDDDPDAPDWGFVAARQKPAEGRKWDTLVVDPRNDVSDDARILMAFVARRIRMSKTGSLTIGMEAVDDERSALVITREHVAGGARYVIRLA